MTYRNSTDPDLTEWDLILVSTSAGKDSQAMLEYVAKLADDAGVLDRVVAVHADLGRVEWQGTKELAKEQADHYGIRFVVCKRDKGDLLDQVMDRGMWPGNTTRYCTSDQKRDPIAKVVTALVREIKGTWSKDKAKAQRVRLLNCMGLRAEESPGRAKREALTLNKRWTNKTMREVWDWLPILDWTAGQVWWTIGLAGTRHHWAYDEGMPRLSCCFCFFAPFEGLVLAGRLNRELLDEHVRVEQAIGHTFRVDLRIEDVRAEVARRETEGASATADGDVADIATWCC